MPIYEYRCENGHTFEAFQSMSDDALEVCEVCDASASRVLSAPAVHFKGSGFYTTDYARKGAKKAPSDGSGDSSSGDSSSGGSGDGGGSSSEGSKSTGSDSSSSKKAEKKKTAASSD